MRCVYGVPLNADMEIDFNDYYQWAQTPFVNVINEGVFAVDTFFFISGLLVAMVPLRAMEK